MSQVWRVSVGKMPDRQKMGRQTLGSTFQIRMAPSTESGIYKWFSTLKELAPKHFGNLAILLDWEKHKRDFLKKHQSNLLGLHNLSLDSERNGQLPNNNTWSSKLSLMRLISSPHCSQPRQTWRRPSTASWSTRSRDRTRTATRRTCPTSGRRRCPELEVQGSTPATMTSVFSVT